MTDEDTENGQGESEEQSFRERVEEIREKRAEEGDGEGEPPESPFGGGGGPGMGGSGMGGGNPMAQMMGGGPGGPPSGAGEQKTSNEELVSEVRQLRDEMRDQTRTLKRIADAIEDS